MHQRLRAVLLRGCRMSLRGCNMPLRGCSALRDVLQPDLGVGQSRRL